MALSPLHIFPEEIWLEIADKVDGSQSWLNLSRASREIGAALESKKADKLFLVVLIFLKSYLGNQDLLKLRLISKSWKRAVEFQAENELMTWMYKSKFNYIAFHKSTDIWRFLEEMKTHPGNPFVGRWVSFKSPSDEEELPTIFWNSAAELVKRFGKEIAGLFLDARDSQVDTDFKFGIELYRILKHVPALKGLCIDYKNEMIVDATPSLDLKSLDGVQPNLKQLEIFMMFCSNHSTSEFIFRLLNKMCKIPEKLTHLYSNHFQDCLPTLFPNIQVIEGSFTFEDWKILKDSGWPLTEICDDSCFHLPMRLECIEIFHSTLTSLEVRCVKGVQESWEKIRLPKLKVLRIKYNQSFSLGVLSELKSLEVLIIERPTLDSSDNGLDAPCETEISNGRDMYTSSIWRVLPKLKMFRFENKIYQRKTHEKL